jgi:flagellar biosynthesis protein
VKLLMQVDLDQQIPPQLYLAVAELMAWIYRLEDKAAISEAAGEGRAVH